MQSLNELSDIALRKEQQMLDKLEQTKKNLTQQVSADELDDLMRIETDQLEGTVPAQKH